MGIWAEDSAHGLPEQTVGQFIMLWDQTSCFAFGRLQQIAAGLREAARFVLILPGFVIPFRLPLYR